MKPRILSVARLSLQLATAFAALLASQPLQAATITWTGDSLDDANWNTPANWDATLTNGDDLIFTGTNRQTNTKIILNMREKI